MTNSGNHKEDNETKNPFNELVQDEKTASEEVRSSFAALLKPHVKILQEQKKVILTAEGQDLPAQQMLLIFFVAQFAMHDLEMVEEETLSSTTVIEMLERQGIPAGTTKPTLSKLTDKNYLHKVSRGQYRVLPTRSAAIISEFNSQE